MAKQVSIITLNWNGQRWLDRCLSSLLDQTYPNTEVIMVDNGSTDDSVAYVRQNFSAVKIVENGANLGFASGLNAGISVASGELILLINNDTYVERDFVEKLVRHYRERKLDVISPMSTEYENPKYRLQATTLDVLGHPVVYRDLKPDNHAKCLYLSGVAMLCSKELYTKSRGLDGNFFMYFEEADWFWRLRLLEKKFAFDNETFVFHVGAGSTGGKSGIKLNMFIWRNQNNLQMLLKNYAWYNLLWVLPLYVIQNIFEMIAWMVMLKPKVAATYLQGYAFNIRHLKRTLRGRRWVQQHRKIGDSAIFREMYWGPGKLKHLFDYFGKG